MMPMLIAWIWFCIRDNHFTGIFTAIVFREKRVASYFRIAALFAATSISAYVAARLDVARVNACTPGSKGYNPEDCRVGKDKAITKASSIIGQWLLADLMIILARFMERRLLQEKKRKTCMNVTLMRLLALSIPAVISILTIYLTVRAYNGGVAMGDEEKKEEEYFKRNKKTQFGGSTSSVLHGGARAPGVQYIKPEQPFSAGELFARMVLSWVLKAGLSLMSVVSKSYAKEEDKRVRTVQDVQEYFDKADDQITPFGMCDNCCWTCCCCGELPMTAPTNQQPPALPQPAPTSPPPAQGFPAKQPITPPLKPPSATYGNQYSQQLPHQQPQQYPQQHPHQQPQQYSWQQPQQQPQQFNSQQYPQQQPQQYPQQQPQLRGDGQYYYDQNQYQYYQPTYSAAPGVPHNSTSV